VNAEVGMRRTQRRLVALSLGAAALAAGVGAHVATRPPRRVAVLAPDGALEFTLMDFSRPFPLDPPPPGWWSRRFWTSPPMRLSFVEKDGVPALRMATDASASMLFRFVDVPLSEYPLLRWKWFVEKPISSDRDERERDGDDHPARFFLVLRTAAGDERRLEIVWGDRLLRGDVKFIGTFPHYVADGGDANVGRWREEEVDLAALARRFFPDAGAARLTDIAVFCDSDDTRTSSVAYLADVRVARR
jgi:Protein of unknown function (DUF3047)